MSIALSLGLIISLLLWSAARIRTRPTSTHLNPLEADPFLKKTFWTKKW